MKKRIKIDSSLLSFVIILTGFLYAFPHLYPHSLFWDNFLDILGVITILKGNILRMTARGHKKAHSQRSQSLVADGPYTICRNPMYLGSYLIGAGFILVVWPWWTLPVFTWLFYIRFKKEVVKEEKFLGEMFKEEYTKYCSKVPRIFPHLSTVFKIKVHNVLDMSETFSTKETAGLFAWPILAVVLETFQQKIVFGYIDIVETIALFLIAIVTFTVAFIISYQIK
jgi:protein-S-isoprenylcysteine O-methyltransferase Ste14